MGRSWQPREFLQRNTFFHRALLFPRNITNRWTGATGSDFRIKRDSAKLLGSAVARSTQALYVFALIGGIGMRHLIRITILCAAATVCAFPTFAQRNDQLIPNDLAIAIRRVMTPVEGTAWVYAYFSGDEIGDIAIVGIADKGTSCPAMFRIVYPDSSPRDPQYHATQEFGDCSDIPTINFQRNRITLTFPGWAPYRESSRPGFRGYPPPTTYVFANRTLRQIKAPTQTKRRT